jgi:hypothetical protein
MSRLFSRQPNTRLYDFPIDVDFFHEANAKAILSRLDCDIA